MTEREQLVLRLIAAFDMKRATAEYWAAVLLGDDVSDVVLIDERGRQRTPPACIMPELLEAIGE